MADPLAFGVKFDRIPMVKLEDIGKSYKVVYPDEEITLGTVKVEVVRICVNSFCF